MKVVILAGGYGTRISEESRFKPKPLIEIDDMPILWHIMKSYSLFGYNEFVICAGYKAHMVKKFFAQYYLYRSDITFDFTNGNEMTIQKNTAESWKVTVADTGLNTMTGGRLKQVQKYVDGETFMLTYGDAVSDVDINEVLAFHKSQDKIATITAVQPSGRFGAMEINSHGAVDVFAEKNKEDNGWINAGFMVFEPGIFDYLGDDLTVLEREPFERLASDGEMAAYQYKGFWQCMDTLREKNMLESMIARGKAPWIKW